MYCFSHSFQPYSSFFILQPGQGPIYSAPLLKTLPGLPLPTGPQPNPLACFPGAPACPACPVLAVLLVFLLTHPALLTRHVLNTTPSQAGRLLASQLPWALLHRPLSAGLFCIS